jgi:hypothetical protein
MATDAIVMKEGKLKTPQKKANKDRYSIEDFGNAIQIGAQIEEDDSITLKELARQVMVDKNTVKSHVEVYQKMLPAMQSEARHSWFVRNECKIYESIKDLACEKLIEKIRAGELQGKELTNAIDVLTRVGRLQAGKSTENIAHAHTVTPQQSIDVAQITMQPPPKKE